MNTIHFYATIKMLVFILTLLLMLLNFSGCGGGFSNNSDNASQFQNSIFGNDTLE